MLTHSNGTYVVAPLDRPTPDLQPQALHHAFACCLVS
jgi:hypothetical protein